MGGAASYSVDNVAAGTYYVRVRAVNAWGVSRPSNEISGTVEPPAPPPLPPPAPCGAPPSAPIDLWGVVSGDTVTLTWSAPTGGCAATSYRIDAGTSPGGADIGPFDTSATSYTVPNVTAGTYYVRVRAVNPWGVSGPSNEIYGTVGGPEH